MCKLHELIKNPLYQATVSENNNGFIVWNTDFDIAFMNNAFKKIFSLTDDDIGRSVELFLTSDVKDLVEEIRLQTLNSEYGIWSKNENTAGEKIITCLWYNKRIMEDGKPIGITSEVQDVSNFLSINDHMEILANNLEHCDSIMSKTQNEISCSDAIIVKTIQKIKEIDETIGHQIQDLHGKTDSIKNQQEDSKVILINLKIQASKIGQVGKVFNVVADNLEVYTEGLSIEADKISEQLDSMSKNYLLLLELRKELIHHTDENSSFFSLISELIEEHSGILEKLKGMVKSLNNHIFEE